MYEFWIDNNVTETYGTCNQVTQQMVIEFPDLTRVRGHYLCPLWGQREHWWLVDPEGEIVDPTKKQFPSKGTGQYIPLKEGTPEPTGKCPNCSAYVYDGNTCCCPGCFKEYIEFCTTGRFQ